MGFDYSYVDLAFRNGKIVTVNKNDDICEAVGVKGNKIVFVGSNEDLDKIVDKNTKIVDLKGRSLLPGFIDAHYHPILAGLIGTDLDSGMLNTSIDNIKSLAELFDYIRACVATKNPGEWISSMGFDGILVPEHRWPTLEELDEISPDNPLQVMHFGGHFSYYNSKALAYLGVYGPEDAKKYPEDAVEVVNGKLTGRVNDHTHFWLWGQIPYSEEVQTKAALKMQEHLLENGVTSIHDTGECGASSYHIMQKLCRERKFRVRSYMVLHDIFGKPFSYAENEHWMGLGLMTGLGNEYFRIGSCKFMVDGDTGGPNCATFEPYCGDHPWNFVMGWEKDEIAEYLLKINRAECQATAHVMGDLALDYMVSGYEKCYEEDPERTIRLRNRIEHCSMAFPELIPRMAKMNIVPINNPGFLVRDGRNYDEYFGERVKYITPLRSMLDAGIKAALASDTPSGPAGIALIDGCVNRKSRMHDFQLDQSECISVLEAIRCYTLNGAYASFEEDIKGSVEIGKLADFTIISDDILTYPKERINELMVDMTVIDGKIEFER